jgi:hypothetical protein
VLLLAILFPSPLRAEDDAIRKDIAKLANRNADTRQEAIESLTQTRDARVAGVLQAMFQGNLVLYKGQVCVRQEAPAAGGKSFVSLLDPLTQEPLLDTAKKPLLIDAD